jgi:hypothetical protein
METSLFFLYKIVEQEGRICSACQGWYQWEWGEGDKGHGRAIIV